MDRLLASDYERLGPAVTSVSCDQCRAIIDVFIPEGLFLPLPSSSPGAALQLEGDGLRLCPGCAVDRTSEVDKRALVATFDRLRAFRGRIGLPDEVTAYSLVGLPFPNHPRLKDANIQVLAVRVERMPDEWQVPFLRLQFADTQLAPITLALFGIQVGFPGIDGVLEMRWAPSDGFNGEPVVELAGLPPIESLRSFKAVKRLVDGLEIVKAVKGGRPPGARKIPKDRFPELATEAYRSIYARTLERPFYIDLATELGISETVFSEQLGEARRLGMVWPPT